MRRYETIFISNPDIPANQRDDLFDRVKNLIDQEDGFLVEFDEWGTKKLAYEIKKKMVGHYVRIDYCGPAKLINEMERSFRIDDNVMKYMTILLNTKVDLDAVKEEAAQKASAKEAMNQAESDSKHQTEKTSPEDTTADEKTTTDETKETAKGEE